MSHAQILGAWVGSFVDELVACGLRDVCLCPGSRSTPLAISFVRHPEVKVWTHLDERSCAYFALGMAKARPAKPVAILCSSGTAAVNFAPAVVEAFHSRVPLIVLTADRPPELQDLGANQTIDQHRLYGSAVKWFSHLPLPEASPDMLRYVRTIARRAVATAQEAPMGPVHIDAMFREPLVPAAFEYKDRTSGAANSALSASREGVGGGVEGSPQRVTLPFDAVHVDRPLIVAGPQAGVDPETLLTLAGRLAAPVLADPLSGLRSLTRPSETVLSSYDAFLRPPAVSEAFRPGFILRLGDPPSSKPLATYLARYRDVPQYAVAPPGKWPDPDLSAAAVLHGDATAVCVAILDTIGERATPANGWLQSWQDAEARASSAIDAVLGELDAVSEISAVTDLAGAVPDGAYVFAGNSMPVRDIDGFFATRGKQVTLLGSRGASGIDGVVSTALGVAARSGEPTALVIGDLSFYHDMNGLLAAGRHHLSATIVLINNDGGGIFSFLPQHEQSEDFELLFGTPHGLDFSYVSPLYGVGFQRVETRQQYRDALKASFDSPGVQVIEVRTDREENLKLHQRIWAAVAEAVTPLATGGERS
jgi:2-succinyl-5-enolpyruvyl-6-hydroxy-3-cyclohexene-1-carboxylate synthase